MHTESHTHAHTHARAHTHTHARTHSQIVMWLFALECLLLLASEGSHPMRYFVGYRFTEVHTRIHMRARIPFPHPPMGLLRLCHTHTTPPRPPPTHSHTISTNCRESGRPLRGGTASTLSFLTPRSSSRSFRRCVFVCMWRCGYVSMRRCVYVPDSLILPGV